MSSLTTRAFHTNISAEWTQYLHRRVMRLLLQYDQPLFQGHFRLFYAQSAQPTLPLLQLYDDYLRLLLLKDELLDDIIPRIKRQLSLQTNYYLTQEDAPTRGEIDWPRTINRTLNETPDLLPVRFDTFEQQRSMAVPENLFAISILLSYRQGIQNIRKRDLSDEALNDQEQQQLIEIEERIERELTAPFIQALLPQAKNLNIEQLADQVRQRLPPGESAFRDLFQWWEQFNSLHIGKTMGSHQLTLLHKQSSEKNNAQLYELWIALELLSMLTEKRSVLPADVKIEKGRIQFHFIWDERNFLFTYRSQLLEESDLLAGWKNVPTTTPHFTITREKPLELFSEQHAIWCEPPVILASFYEHTTDARSVNYVNSLQKILGEMQLTSARHAVLFAPTLPDPIDTEPAPRVQRLASVYTEGMSYNLANPAIRLCKLTPGMELNALHDRLRTLLNDIASRATFPEPVEPACHGIILDEDTINASRSRQAAYNILCPKPHVGAGVFDLVNDKIHCLKDPTICHIYGQAKLAPFVIRAVTSEAMNQQSSDIRAKADQTLSQAEKNGDEDKAEQLRNHIFLGVGRAVEQYVKLRGNTTTLEAQFEEWIFGEYWKKHSRCLAEETRNILLSGAYVWDEYKQTVLNDWAAPAVQYCRALEIEIKRRLHDYYLDPHLNGFKLKNQLMTLGAIKYIYLNRAIKSDAKHNWGLFTQIVAHSHSDMQEFTTIIGRMDSEHIADNRNKLAHSNPIPQAIAQELRDAIIGHKKKPGVLCWLAEHLEPKI